jgi:hypothetical protein
LSFLLSIFVYLDDPNKNNQGMGGEGEFSDCEFKSTKTILNFLKFNGNIISQFLNQFNLQTRKLLPPIKEFSIIMRKISFASSNNSLLRAINLFVVSNYHVRSPSG